MTHIIMSIILILASFQVGCASRQYAIYKINVERHVKKNFDSSVCEKNGKHRFRVKIDNNWQIVNIEAEKGTPDDQCSKNLRRAIQASSPLPAAPPLVQNEAIAEGFNIGI